ncbi:hypothetical protein JVU11DRAFT_11412 [Chiua virens]|nr:hypothetical protein JVU11DRAFT_11412 [Chiua virens]
MATVSSECDTLVTAVVARLDNAVPSFLMDLDPDPVSLSTPMLTSRVLWAPSVPTPTPPTPGLLSADPPAIPASLNQMMPTAPTPTPPNPGSISTPPTLPDAHTLHSPAIPTSLNQTPTPHTVRTQPYTPSTPIPPAARSHSRPLPLPEALESVIHCVVTERLDSTTTHLVDSTVRGVVDACVPHLEKFIDMKLTCLAMRNVGNSDGWDGDDEDDNEDALVLSHRKKLGTHGHMNYLHVSSVFLVPRARIDTLRIHL